MPTFSLTILEPYLLRWLWLTAVCVLNLQFQAEADKAGLKVGTKHRVVWKGQVAQAEISRVDADGKIVGGKRG